MQTANILLSIGGHHGNTVPKFDVTAAEITVLRAIHGDESVKDVEPGRVIQRSNNAELARLRDIYGNAKDEHGNNIVQTLFPGVAARVHQSLQELGLPEEFYKAIGRMTPGSAATIRHDGPTVSEWVAAGYFADNYPPEDYASKSTQEEIDAAVAKQTAARAALAQKLGTPADEEVGDADGIGDMEDEIAEGDDAGAKDGENLFG
jgi:hypothetical protein